MGSRARHSSGRKASSFRARKGATAKSPRLPADESQPKTGVLLERLNDLLSLFLVTADALAHREDPGLQTVAELSDGITTLKQAARSLQSLCDEMEDVLQPEAEP